MTKLCDFKDDLNDSGITMYVIGITDGFNAIDFQCLIEEQPGNIDNYVISIPTFTPQLFYMIEAQLRSVVCPPQLSLSSKLKTSNINLYIQNMDGTSNLSTNLCAALLLILMAVCIVIYIIRSRKYKSNNDNIYETQYQYQSV